MISTHSYQIQIQIHTKANTDKIEVIFKVGRKLTRLGASGANEADTRVGRWFG